jgi:hypothetical protein
MANSNNEKPTWLKVEVYLINITDQNKRLSGEIKIDTGCSELA